jgi:hypothetical protein
MIFYKYNHYIWRNKKAYRFKKYLYAFLLSILERLMIVPNIINGWSGAFRGY